VSHPQRLERLRAGLQARHLDGLLVSQPESRYYLSGYSGHDLPPRDSAGYLLVTTSEALLLTDPRTTAQAEQQAPDFQTMTYSAGNRGTSAVAQAAAKLNVPKLGFESAHLPYAMWRDIRDQLPSSTELVPEDGLVDELRAIKDAEELAQLQRAIEIGRASCRERV